MSKTSLPYWDVPLNVATGCTPISTGCARCWARTMARRMDGMGFPAYAGAADGFEVRVHPDRIERAYLRGFGRKPKRVFVCNMGDLFHADVRDSIADAVMLIAQQHPRHTFLVLTKRAERMGHYFCDRAALGRCIPPNVWAGVTAENQEMADERMPWLVRAPVAVRWVSVEPMVGPVWLTRWAHAIHWCVIGGESGPGARRLDESSALDLAMKMRESGVAVWFKQWGSAWRGRPAVLPCVGQVTEVPGGGR